MRAVIKPPLRVLRMMFETSSNVLSNLGASAIDQQRYEQAIVFIGLSAILTAAKSTTEHYLSDGERARAETALTNVVKERGGMIEALTALASGDATSEEISREKAGQLLSVLTDPNVDAAPRTEELILHIGKWLEKQEVAREESWQNFKRNNAQVAAQVRASLESFGKKIDEIKTEGREQHQQLMSAVQSVSVSASIALNEFERATQFYKLKDCEAAILLLEPLVKRPDLDPPQRYAALKLLGKAYAAGRDDITRSANCFLDAKACCPDFEEALALEVIAQLNLGNAPRAQELLDALLARFPRSPLGNAARIRLAPVELAFDELTALVPTDLLLNPDVCLAMTNRALAEDDLGRAEEYARRVYAFDSTDPDYSALLGQVILERERKHAAIEPSGNVVVRDRDRIEEVIRLLSHAIERFANIGRRTRLSHLLVCRGIAFVFLGNREASERDHNAAHAELPNDPEALFQVALLDLNGSKTDRAIERLRTSVKAEPRSRAIVLLAQTLEERKRPGDIDEAIALLRHFISIASDADQWLRVAGVDQLFRLLCDTGAEQSATEMLRALPLDFVPKSISEVLESHGAEVRNDREEMKRRARAAATHVDVSGRGEYVYGVASALMHAGLHEEALEFWVKLASPARIDGASFGLIRAAQFAKNDRVILDYLESLRKNKVFSYQFFEVEIHTLFRYNAFARAKDVFAEFTNSDRSEREKSSARALFSMMAINFGETDSVIRDASLLPKVEEVNAREGEFVAHILGWGETPIQAVEYAYSLIRRFPNAKEAHRAVIRSFITDIAHKLVVPESTVVAEGFAFCLAEEGVADTWYTI